MALGIYFKLLTCLALKSEISRSLWSRSLAWFCSRIMEECLGCCQSKFSIGESNQSKYNMQTAGDYLSIEEWFMTILGLGI